MYSPKIKQDLIPELYERANKLGMTMTKYLDGLLRPVLKKDREVFYKCHNCQTLVEDEVHDNKAYCEYCESEVFVVKA